MKKNNEKDSFAPSDSLGFSGSGAVRKALEYVESTAGAANVGNLQGLSMGLFLLAAAERIAGPALVILQDDEAVNRAEDELSLLLQFQRRTGAFEILTLPDFDVFELEAPLAMEERRRRRLRALYGIFFPRTGAKQLVLATPGGALRYTLSKPDYLKNTLELAPETSISPDKTLEFLAASGYERNRNIDRPGRMVLRGGVLDAWPAHAELPVRIEFYGDTVDLIRNFDPETQRSKDKIDRTVFTPASEVIFGPPPDSPIFRKDHLELIRRNISFDASVLYPATFGSSANLLTGGIFCSLFIADPARSLQSWEKNSQSALEWFAKKNFPLPMDLFGNIYTEMPKDTSKYAKTVHLDPFTVGNRGVDLPVKMLPPLPLDLGEIAKILRKECAEGLVAIISRYRKRLEHYLLDEGLESVLVFEGAARGGFRLDDIPLSVFTDSEMFQRRAEPKVVVRRETERRPLVAPSDIEVGDYVVHVDHGVGRYQGIITQTSPDGVTRDFFSLSYARGDNLFVPIEQIERIEKYIGAEGGPPKVYPLHSGRWGRVKSRAKAKIEDMAASLYALYSEREQARGYAFAPDNLFMQELEEAFPFDETEDQITSIERVKKEMEKPKPMDHLVYGDVGYGKTEVAIRAAFKATLDKKQVALLAPTTILTQQHARTFRERFARFPVTIEVINRFRPPKEQKKILKRLAAGEIDLLIGTHRLLQDDVRFKDLGLLIVDEEQRFGVKHKERLKAIKINVDVLTLTATPIPRTLHMSMIGLRDMSLIETPPEDRKAVKTFVEEWNINSLYTAFERELARGGQIFFVHNDIASIDQVRQFISNTFPDARIAICHGQMPSLEIETTMDAFMEKKYDILLSTTIIENGLDIPNVNTLIVNSAENFGLSQLYQLRGRVGRSFRQSYAYFFYSPYKMLSEKAQKRLDALRDFADLGSGYRLAMKDLEIRGAGNLLGKEQHGFIAEIGFNLYCRMLAESVEKVRGTPLQMAPQVEVDLAVNAYIPDDYVPDTPIRTDLYKQLVSATTIGRVIRIFEEITDRFGAPPQPLASFIILTKIKIHARTVGVDKLKTHPHSELTDMTFREPRFFEAAKNLPYPNKFPLEVVYLKDRLRFLHEGIRPVRVVEALHDFLVLAAATVEPEDDL